MKAVDLAPSERRLLRHCGRIDPNPCVTMPGEWGAAEELRRAGLVEHVEGRPKSHYRITEKGRGALR